MCPLFGRRVARDWLGGVLVIKTGIVVGAAILAFVALPALHAAPGNAKPPVRVAETACFLKKEETSGFNKICYYDCGAAITIKSSESCPMTIHR